MQLLSYHTDQLNSDRRQIYKEFCGLDTDRLLKNFDEGNAPSFKEVTSLTMASINFVYELDKILINNIDLTLYADRVLIDHIRSHGKKKDDMAKVINNIFLKDTTTARRIIKQILAQNGFSTGDTANEVDVFCERVSELSCKDATNHYKRNSFL